MPDILEKNILRHLISSWEKAEKVRVGSGFQNDFALLDKKK